MDRNNLKLISTKEAMDIDVKRFYLDGVKVEWTCPSCGERNERDFGSDYISYPSANNDEYYGVYCPECDEGYKFKGRLNIGFEVIDGTLIKD